jgi:hypothetical protein
MGGGRSGAADAGDVGREAIAVQRVELVLEAADPERRRTIGGEDPASVKPSSRAFHRFRELDREARMQAIDRDRDACRIIVPPGVAVLTR